MSAGAFIGAVRGPVRNVGGVTTQVNLTFGSVVNVTLIFDNGNPPGPLSRLKSLLCRAIPAGRTTSISASFGAVVSSSLSLAIVVNYRTGQMSLFNAGGAQLGWNGGFSAGLSTGPIYGPLRPGNGNYAGWFTGVTGSGRVLGGATLGVSKGGGPWVPTVGGSVGLSAAGGGVNATYYERPLDVGSVFSGGTSFDQALTVISQVCR